MNIVLCAIGGMKNPKEASRITVLALAEELVKRGHHVSVVARMREGLAREEKVGNVTIYRISPSFLFSAMKGVEYVQKKTGRQFDILHGSSATPLFVVALWLAKRKARGAKIIHTLRSYSRSRIGNMFYFLLRLADKVTVPTSQFKKRVKGLLKVDVVNSPLRLAQFTLEKSKPELKEKYGYSGKTILFNYGSLHREKGADILLKALPVIMQDHPQVHMIFAPRYAKLEPEKALVKRLGIETKVKFVTHNIPIHEYVAMADYLVVPYISLFGTEGTPSSLLEAMASGTLVITTDLPELEEAFHDCAVMVTPGSVESLQRTLRNVLAPSFATEKNRLLRNAKEQAAQFDVKHIADQFLILYEEMR